ncbi:DUF6090 family protein [Ekhidna sp.]
MKNINWLDHIANLLVVILGISIAFYLEGYKEESNSKKLERKYLESLISDLDIDIQALDTLRSVNDRISTSLVTLSEASIGRPYGSDTALMNHILTIQYNPPFSPQRTTYESLKASGKMDLINDFNIRNEIVDLYEQYYRGTGEYDVSINEHVRDFVKPFYINQIRFNSAQSLNPEFLPKDEFRNMIFAYRYLFIAKCGFYDNVRNRAQSLRNELEDYSSQL